MSAFAGSDPWALELARNLGEDPTLVRRIEIIIAPDEVVHAVVTKMLDKEKNKEALEQILKLAWLEKSRKVDNE